MAYKRKYVDKRMVRLQAEAYYQAMKRYDEEKEIQESKEENISKIARKDIGLISNVLLWPWKINEKYKINNRIYDSILVIIITTLFSTCGTLLWGGGCITFITAIFKKCIGEISVGIMIIDFVLSIGMIMFGSVFIVSGNEFSKVTDSNKIYAYSASILAAVSCVIALIALVI